MALLVVFIRTNLMRRQKDALQFQYFYWRQQSLIISCTSLNIERIGINCIHKENSNVLQHKISFENIITI